MANTFTKFNRNYSLFVQTETGEILNITLPFTVEFDVHRKLLSSANDAKIRVYNLSQKHRNAVRHNLNDYGNIKTCVLLAGYGDNLATIFNGNISEAFSVRESVDFITEISSYDSGNAFQNADVNGNNFAPIPAGTPQKDKIIGLVKTMAPFGVTQGAFGNLPGTVSKAESYSGPTIDILRDETGSSAGSGFFIDNGRASYLNENECIAGPSVVINQDSGLLGTPVLEATLLRFDMIFQPNLFIGQQVQLQSANFQDIDGRNINGFYKVVEIHHKGMVSPAVCGDAITTVTLYYGVGALIQVPLAS